MVNKTLLTTRSTPAAPPDHKPHPTPPLIKKETPKRKFDAQNGDPESSHLDFYSEQKVTDLVNTCVSNSQPPLRNDWNFDPYYSRRSSLLPAEERFGIIHVRIKPLIFSLGWIRFQSISIYSLDDHSIRMRTWMHCCATFYGCSHSTQRQLLRFLFTISWYSLKVGVTATGVLLDVHRTTKIVRKLKLKGVPSNIFKITAWKSLNLEKPKFELFLG